MKKFNAIFLLIVFAITVFSFGCSASGKVSVNKQQSVKTVYSAK